ncbi:Phosphate-repressible phosphate permease pho-4 {ECO:0000303/PubMed:2531109} [Serendipita indica DSM 11827]|uniref:Phosphate transporter n=1 Tax=Serendipita indica (strain DSM 11827) TaxID=1109443 RepID=G4T6U2_SERID|nr:Phosphate-repressible phosphate permease pho-4 {ECO:0000303/PubMed:2531109} [Serendipita indica DSM 11827]CCA67029.1 related to PHO-4 phosphate-repressible phosphate permease [Serendipita indica DSM 11827]
MPYLHQFDYIFAIGLIFAFLDAWNIGANDVANSFATSVSSRSLTMKQAMIIASFCEFGGAVLVGARVADTIRSKIINVNRFKDQPEVLMLGMMCALVGSSTYLTIATKIGLPVSTTHCIVGAVIGVGVATIGADGVVWGWKGVSQVFAAWVIAPAIAGAFAAILFTITKYGVLKRENSFRKGLIAIPFYFALTSGVLTMMVVWKGAPALKVDKLSQGEIIGTILGVAFGVALICVVFFLPYLYRRLMLEDWTLRWYHVFQGPLLLRRGPVPPPPADEHHQIVQDYYRGHLTREQLEARRNAHPGDAEKAPVHTEQSSETGTPKGAAASSEASSDHQHPHHQSHVQTYVESKGLPPFEGAWYKPKNLWTIATWAFFRGVHRDPATEQTTAKGNFLVGDLDDMHARVEHHDNKTEHLYSFLQVMTAMTASFAHGSNDVSNAMGPLATIYLVWSTDTIASKAPVPIWVLVFGGAAIVIGLWTYGYHIMRNLGNRLTLHSPSRGFSMELGAALTVVLATRLALPISTTQCIVGATVGVGLCAGDFKAINWRMVAWIYMGWFITLPCTGLIAGCLMAFVINAPRW